MSAILVAELSANHGHRLETALATVRAAKESGADAIKLQTYTPDTITLDCDDDPFQIRQGTLWDGTTLHRLYAEAFTPWEWHEPIRDLAHQLGLGFFSTPFDHTAVDFLDKLGVPMFKIASFEINDLPLIEYTASKGKPMVLSTGVALAGEIQDAVQACRSKGCTDITLLKCTSSYPAPPEEANLRTIPDLARTFQVKAGLSDHTIGPVAALGAIALGATMIEKHFILDRSIGGPDATFSMLPSEFKEMSGMIRQLEASLGKVEYEPTPKARANFFFRRSLFVAEDMKAGDLVDSRNVRSVRPGVGASPSLLPGILGRRVKRDLRKGTPFQLEMLEES